MVPHNQIQKYKFIIILYLTSINEPPLKMPSLANARTAFIKTCVPQKFDGGIHAVTFQPKPTIKNEDRYVVQYWDDIDGGPPWLFLAVLDGEF